MTEQLAQKTWREAYDREDKDMNFSERFERDQEFGGEFEFWDSNDLPSFRYFDGGCNNYRIYVEKISTLGNTSISHS